MAGGGEIAKTEADVTLMQVSARAPRRWNRGFAILGYLQTH